MLIPADTPYPIRTSKRVMDIIFSLTFLVVSSPIWMLLLVVTAIDFLLRPADRGPLFYHEPRISRGRLFTILKFRTVKQPLIKARRESPEGLKTVKLLERDNQNLTWTGRWLRDFYLDELPQLLNILRGDMSFIGPRPWPEEDWHAQRRQGYNTKGVIPCGLTGLVQCCKGKNLDSTKLDLEYIEAYRTKSPLGLLLFDLSILYRSVRTMLEGKGI